MNWVRVNNSLPGSPKIIALARELCCSVNEALGVAVRWLCWLDAHTVDGKSGLLANEVNFMVCDQDGATEALESIGWAEVDDNGYVYAKNYDEFCSAGAKKRAQGAARVKRMRERKKGGRK